MQRLSIKIINNNNNNIGFNVFRHKDFVLLGLEIHV